MKKVTVTYHMHRGNTTAETCIDLPMEDQVAADLVKGEYCGNCVLLTPQLYALVTALALFQGYGEGIVQDIRYAKEMTNGGPGYPSE